MAASAIGMIRLRNLFAVVMLSGIFSLSAAALYVVLDAVDVAFTEASVGAGIATVLMLSTLALTTTEEAIKDHRNMSALVVVLIAGAVLIYGTLDMPFYGDPMAPIHLHVAPLYLRDSIVATSVPNVVTSVLASYRGYDTLGETTVIFTAAASVMALIGRGRKKIKYGIPDGAPSHGYSSMKPHPILRVTAKLLIPAILIYAFYVQAHGDFGPGGGFQAGVILGATFILYALIFGVDNTRVVIRGWVRRAMMASGVLIYAGTGVAALLLGGNYLDYSVLLHDPVHGQHIGIFLVELGVGITVSGSMITIFLIFAGQDR
ncbi:Na(+)/H(+) antiporter subunit B [Shumkonia mesophila]|uniref:Na(+)/H(+) antiporter subunit B n=1 Tax=Shumkonia mesophila TaxID=2838854 RepID=UPI00293413D0|nr:Na(+)/H(+) antiporter subunit B [Shumkonia mesophila]